MYYKTILKNGAVIIAASLLTLTACNRKDKSSSTTTTPALTNTDDNGGYASDAAKLESNNNDVISIVDIAAAGNTSTLRTTSGFPVATNDTTATPHLLTVDFGPSNHLCADGKYRKGKILVSYMGRYKDNGSMHTITYSNYYVNDVQRTGSKTVTNKGANTSGNVWYEVTVNDTLIFAPDSMISWTGNRTRTWLTGYSTATRSDDSYEIGGTTALTRANGHVFTHTITTPLKVEVSCNYIESGVVTVTGSSLSGGSRTIDYGFGTGGCDDQAQVTIGTRTYTITLH
ncbi:MAG: hypothetical protein JWQ38_1235 [Flavipsychrobacter sp.]|nr:hypothetical protein [Flavipsychrobacter sp.]